MSLTCAVYCYKLTCTIGMAYGSPAYTIYCLLVVGTWYCWRSENRTMQ